MKISNQQRKQARGDWEETSYGNKELKLIPRFTYDKNFPKYEKVYDIIFKSEYRKNPRKYTQVT